MRILVVAIAIIALAAVSFYAVQALPPQIEADLKHRSSAALADANLQFASVSVKGRVVTLTGEAPGPMAKEDAVKIVQNVWGVASVTDALKVSSAARPAALQTVIASASPATEPAATPAPVAPQPEPQPVAPPPTEQPSPSSALPTVDGVIDPALAPPEPQPVAPPPTEQPSPSSALPTVDGVIDPALAPPTDSAQPELVPAPAEAPPATEQPATPASPPPPTPDTTPQFSSAPPPAATPAAATAEAAPPSVPQPAVTTPAPPPAVVATTPAPTPAPPPAAAATPTPTPAPVPATPPPPAVIAQGSTAGLTTSVQMAAPPVAPEPPTYRLEAQIDGRRIGLQGLVSTPSAQRALVAHTRRQLWRAQVVDTMQVAHAKPDRDWLSVARIGLSQLAHLDNGSLSIDGHKVSMSGRPRSEADRVHVLAALNGLPAGYTSTVMLERKPDTTPPAPAPTPAVVAEAPRPAPAPSPRVVAPRAPPAAVEAQREERPRRRYATPRPATPRYRSTSRVFVSSHALSSDCRRRFGDVLPRVAVVFDSGSSRVRSNAVSGLDELAHVARSCPRARISLTGHSDTYEASATSLQLSRARAYAVRQALEARGVDGSNISVAARGGLRPAFSNATADGRDNNRRVEFAVW